MRDIGDLRCTPSGGVESFFRSKWGRLKQSSVCFSSSTFLKLGAFPEPGELIGLIVDVKISPEQEKSLLSYTYRLLGSRLSVSPASDEFQVQPLHSPKCNLEVPQR